MHPIDLQHCIAVSAVVVGLQSSPYPTSAIVRTAGKIVLANTILNSLEAFKRQVNLERTNHSQRKLLVGLNALGSAHVKEK
jgi:hypothetical protein